MSPYGTHTQKYERVPEPGSPRQTEGWALIEAAKRMAAAITLGDISDRDVKEKRKSAVKLNWKLWTIFQAELTIENSEMDEEIRLNMLTLCKFVDKHTVGTLIDPADDKISTLIDLNRNIALGLLNMPEEEVDKLADEQAQNVEDSNQEPSPGDGELPPSQKIEISV
jgi:flagellar biosynthesis activator protein FlaF